MFPLGGGHVQAPADPRAGAWTSPLRRWDDRGVLRSLIRVFVEQSRIYSALPLIGAKLGASEPDRDAPSSMRGSIGGNELPLRSV
jgi:hypothetical protein